MRSLKGKHIFSFHTNQWETRSALFVRFYRAAGIDGYGLWNAKHVQEKERQRWRRLQSWLQCGRVQQSAEGGESRQQEPAPLHELRPHRDGWDGLLLGALSRLRQVGGRHLKAGIILKIIFFIFAEFHPVEGRNTRRDWKNWWGEKTQQRGLQDHQFRQVRLRGWFCLFDKFWQDPLSQPSYLAYRERQEDCIV